MVKKLKTYGKRKGLDLASAFGKLTLSSPSDQGNSTPNPESKKTRSFAPVSRHESRVQDALVSRSDNNTRKPDKRREKRRSAEEIFLQENRPTSLSLPTVAAEEGKDRGLQPENIVLVKHYDAAAPTSSSKKEKKSLKDGPLTEEEVNILSPSFRASKNLSAPKLNTAAKETTAPKKTLRSTRHGRATPDAVPNRNLSLDAQAVEYLRPLTELDGASCARSIQLWHADWTSLCTIVKIAEGTYGSVFRMSDKLGSHRPTIGKLMPLKAKSGVGSKKTTNTSIADAVSEIRLLELMNDVPGFVAFRGAEVLIGPLPKALREEYVAFQERESCRNGFNDSYSAAETNFPRHQAWIFIEMDNAGIELERALTDDESAAGALFSVKESGERYLPVQRTRDIFWGVVEALARGEEMHKFEHRDLHLSNICIALSDPSPGQTSDFSLIPTGTNVVVTIIDYTLSRATLPSGDAIFNPMSDPWIFEGDGEVDIQFDIYRHMRELVSSTRRTINPAKTPPPTNHSCWASSHPVTNVLWLYLLLRKLMLYTLRPGFPSQKSEEEELWLSLEELEREINVERRVEYVLLSACDVVRWMEVGKEEFLKEVAEEGEISGVKGRRRRRIMKSGEVEVGG